MGIKNLVTRVDCEEVAEFGKFERDFKDDVVGCTISQTTEGKEIGLFRQHSIRSNRELKQRQ